MSLVSDSAVPDQPASPEQAELFPQTKLSVPLVNITKSKNDMIQEAADTLGFTASFYEVADWVRHKYGVRVYNKTFYYNYRRGLASTKKRRGEQAAFLPGGKTRDMLNKKDLFVEAVESLGNHCSFEEAQAWIVDMYNVHLNNKAHFYATRKRVREKGLHSRTKSKEQILNQCARAVVMLARQLTKDEALKLVNDVFVLKESGQLAL